LKTRFFSRQFSFNVLFMFEYVAELMMGFRERIQASAQDKYDRGGYQDRQ
jgi:hypothetical protein